MGESEKEWYFCLSLGKSGKEGKELIGVRTSGSGAFPTQKNRVDEHWLC